MQMLPTSSAIAEERIAMTCNSDHVYMWSKDGALALKIPNCSTLNGKLKPLPLTISDFRPPIRGMT